MDLSKVCLCFGALHLDRKSVWHPPRSHLHPGIPTHTRWHADKITRRKQAGRRCFCLFLDIPWWLFICDFSGSPLLLQTGTVLPHHNQYSSIKVMNGPFPQPSRVKTNSQDRRIQIHQCGYDGILRQKAAWKLKRERKEIWIPLCYDHLKRRRPWQFHIACQCKKDHLFSSLPEENTHLRNAH